MSAWCLTRKPIGTLVSNEPDRTCDGVKSMGQYKKDVTPLVMHWSYIFPEEKL